MFRALNNIEIRLGFMRFHYIKLSFSTIALFTSISMGAGSTGKPVISEEGNKKEIQLVTHDLVLPPGFSFYEDSILTVVPAEFVASHIIPKQFELPEKIMSKGLLPKNRMISFLWLHNQKIEPEEVEQLVELYVRESAIEGVNHDIAFVQMLLETGYLRFSGDVDKQQNNFCGLGATGMGEKGLSFASMEEGVRAHIQHLKIYASKEPLNQEAVHNRARFVQPGSAENIHDLTGKWATDPLYGKKIDILLASIYDGLQIKPSKTSILFD